MQASIYESLSKEHPDVTYYKREDISLILSKGLAQTCREKPRNPIEYFATWLQEYSQVQKAAKAQTDDAATVSNLTEEHNQHLQAVAGEEAEKQKVADAKQAANDLFWKQLSEGEDPNDNLEGLAQYIHNNVGSTGVYIGQLEPPLRKIADDADDNAHLNLDKPEIIKFKYANEDHKDLIVGTVIQPGQGISHDVFSDNITEANQKVELETCKDIVKQFKHVYVKEVVVEPRMHFWTVPRLGSFMAIPLAYKSCLSVDSFNAAVSDYTRYQSLVSQQELDKATHEAVEEQKKAEKQAAGEQYVPEEKEWEAHELPAIRTELKKFVICLDSMGQDRECTPEQKEFALRAALRFREYWEKFERDQLVADRDALFNARQEDEDKFNEDKLLELKTKEETLVEEKLNPSIEEGAEASKDDKKGAHGHHKSGTNLDHAEEEVNEQAEYEEKQVQVAEIRLQFQLDLLQKDLDYKLRFEALPKMKVVKYQNLIKCIFYILGYDKETICVEGTQKLYWKIARHLWNDTLPLKMEKYQYEGAKSEPIKSYQTINYIEKNLEGLTQDELNKYNHALGLMFKWLQLAIAARKQSIIKRLANSKKLREDRELKIEEEKQRKDDRTQALADAKEKWEVENRAEIERYDTYMADKEAGALDPEDDAEPPTKPVYDEKYFLYEFDAAHPETVIPPEVKDDIDNDWSITSTRKDELLTEYQITVAEALAAASHHPKK